MTAKAFVSGCAGTQLTPDERSFFAVEQPLGLILFGRNCESPSQVRDLVAAFRDAVGRADAPALIDQEGGRVRRLRPPHWPDYPSGRMLGQLAATDRAAGRRAAWLQGRLIAADLRDLGLTVDCAPVLDVLAPGASEAIGNRSFGADAGLVTELGGAFAEGLAAGGVAPVIKHMPGQGRATADSHYALPVVEAALADLVAVDFAPFRALAGLPAGMTSHTVFSAVDPQHPATTSPAVIHGIIRERIGFDGLLFSDDISMNALSGSHGDRTRAILAAGCDIVLHCSGVMAEMREVASAAIGIGGRVRQRVDRLLGSIGTPQPLDREAARAEFDALLGAAAVA